MSQNIIKIESDEIIEKPNKSHVLKNNEIFLNLQTPKLEENVSIHIPIEGGLKKQNNSSCGFGVLSNRSKMLNIFMDESLIKNEFLKDNNVVISKFKKLWRNNFGTTPKGIISGFNKILKEKQQPYELTIKYGLSINDIVEILEKKQPIMVMYIRKQCDFIDILKNKFKNHDDFLEGIKKYLKYGYPHYALLVGLDGNKQTVELLDPNTGKTEEIPFKTRREQFELQSHHSGYIFKFAKKIGLIKERTCIYLTDNKTIPINSNINKI